MTSEVSPDIQRAYAERRREYYREYYRAHRKERREYYQANREERLAYQREYHARQKAQRARMAASADGCE